MVHTPLRLGDLGRAFGTPPDKKPRRSPVRSGGAGTEKRPLQEGKVPHRPCFVNPFSEFSPAQAFWLAFTLGRRGRSKTAPAPARLPDRGRAPWPPGGSFAG